MKAYERAVAIVGVGAIFPDAPNVAAFWNNIINKKYSIREAPPGRWGANNDAYYDPDPRAPDKTYSKIGGWVSGFQFDWKRFRIPPKIAAAMDEGQQWALTIAADALADYGYPERPLNTERTAVIIGTAMGGELHYRTTLRISFPEYVAALATTERFQALPTNLRHELLAEWQRQVEQTIPPITEDSMPGELPNIISGRIANVLDLHGPNFITDAACASSMAAVEAAVELLIEHKVDAALTGGVDRNMGVNSFVKFAKIGALSATGTRPFGDGADGFVMGEGAAVFLLKRLADAEREGDRIYAVIRGVGGASDGKGKGITAPNPIGQQLALERAWHNADLDPATASLIEAHGTSTRVGDVVEVESLNVVFGQAPPGSIGLGSVKSNIGHLKAGAGAAGLLKAVLALHHKVLPPTLNAERPNPNIDFASTPFYLLHEPRPWTVANGTPRRVGVSAYGFGGTNFHVVLEEYTPQLGQQATTEGMGAKGKGEHLGSPLRFDGGEERQAKGRGEHAGSPLHVKTEAPLPPLALRPLRGLLALGANTPTALKEKVDEAVRKANAGWQPAWELPAPTFVTHRERLVIDYGNHAELVDRLHKAQKALGFDNPAAWQALQAQGIFRGHGPRPGQLAFLFPGQGSQYINMGRELAAASPTVQAVFEEADRIMTPILGRPLTSYIFIDPEDKAAMAQAQVDLMQTAITQPAMLTLDTAIYRLLGDYGFQPDMVMGHSLGEYAGLIAAGIQPFHEALEASAARGREMMQLHVPDSGAMAAVMAPYAVVETLLQEVQGYVIPANINSYAQCVIGGEMEAVQRAMRLFEERGYQTMQLPVSHAFHTRIVAPASRPLRQVLDRMHIAPPRLPLVANLTGEFYPHDVEAIKDLLQQQIASPVQWVKGLETLYAAGARTFVEVGPKRALHGFARDVFQSKPDVIALLTNHPKTGELPSFNQALCGLYAAGYAPVGQTYSRSAEGEHTGSSLHVKTGAGMADVTTNEDRALAESRPTAKAVTTNGEERRWEPVAPNEEGRGWETAATDRNQPPAGSVVISGVGLGLPGAEKSVMDPDNAGRILRGEQFVDLIPERFRQRMVNKRIVRVVKGEDGSGSFAVIDDPADVIKLAGRPGSFDLAAEYGVPEALIEALDITSQLAMAAGLDALREAGIPLVMQYKRTTTGKFLPDRWMLPEPLRDETGVIFASAFPGGDRMADEFRRFYLYQNRVEQIEMLEGLLAIAQDGETQREIERRLHPLREQVTREPYHFDRRFLFRILSMGHSQFAQYIGARGPNTQVNAACASTAQAIAIAEDWIRAGRCRRVVIIGADNVTGDHLMEWVGAGFLSVGAATTQDQVDKAALPFDRRRHGTIMGMGACGLVVESEDAVRERGMRAIVELLSSETSNSAFHGTRLDVDHIAQVMDNLVSAAERRFGLSRQDMAGQTVFMSHETYTPARGGSAAAEIVALRHTFGAAANEVVIANTKGFTGHPMGVGIEDVIAVKILEHGIVPPVPNFKEVDPELGAELRLSRGGRYPVHYAIHLAAGFGSQIAMTLTRRIPGRPDRLSNRPRYQRWLDDISGYDRAELEVEKRVLRIKAVGAPTRTPQPTPWQYGLGPSQRTQVGSSGVEKQTYTRPARPEPVPGTETTLRQDSFSTRDGSQPTPTPFAYGDSGRVIQRAAPEDLPIKHPESGATAQTVTTNRHGQSGDIPTPTEYTERPESDLTAQAVTTNRDGHPGASLTPQPVTPVKTGAAPAADIIADKVLAIVAEQTGYPTDMLELDLDLEADLGVDTVKQAETFAAIRQAFDIPRQENLKLRDYPTLGHVIGFVRTMRPDLSMSIGKVSPEPAPTSQPVEMPPAADIIADKVLAIVAEQTGYPTDMLELDLDLEADLGVDTVKQAETFAAIRREFDIPRQENLKLRDYPTLGHVIGFVRTMRPDLGTPTTQRPLPADIPTPQPIPPVQDAPAADIIADKVLAIVAEQTGYPTDMLELDLDLEADLGVDTVKQAETFAAIRREFDIPRQENLKLRDYPTLGHVIGFVRTMRPDLSMSIGKVSSAIAATPAAPVAARPEPAPTPMARPEPLPLANSDRIPRRVPQPALRPPLDWCLPTGVALNEHSRVVVALDQGGVGKALVSRLEKRGVTPLLLDASAPAETITAQIADWLAQGPIQGLYWLPALDVEPELETMDLGQWREANRQRVKNLYTAARALYEAINRPGTFLTAATRLGGLHGYGPDGATAPLGGGVSGFIKAYKREQPDVLVKVVDFAPGRKTAPLADALLQETLTDPGVVEVGYYEDNRYTITLTTKAVTMNEHESAGVSLNAQTVFLVTGAAGGITSAIMADLAAASGGIFYLLDLAAVPDPADPHLSLFRRDREALKQHLIAAMRAAGEKPIPTQIEKQLAAVERSEAALRAIEAIQAAGGVAHYHSLNLLDAPAVTQVVEEIRRTHGRIDILIHAAGVEISKILPDKPAAQFDLVYDIKADGFFTLLRAAQGMPIGATLCFSSVAGRFGNNGQTDYSAANDLLCKLTSYVRQRSIVERASVIDWTAWGEIGMATRGSIPTIMQAAGIDMLAPEVGIPTVRRELLAGGKGSEVVAAGALGVMVQEFHPTGGLDAAKANAWLAQHRPQLLMVGNIQAAEVYAGLRVETTLDPQQQPFLYDHALDGTPLLPGVMGSETFAELASVAAPGYAVHQVLEARFLNPFKFYRMQPQTLYLQARVTPGPDGTLIADTRLTSRRVLGKPGLPPQEKEHFQAQVVLARQPEHSADHQPPSQLVVLPEWLAAPPQMEADAIYRVYFHGPAYQVLDRVWVKGQQAVGLLRQDLPADTRPADAHLLLAPRLMELCFQTAGVWDIQTHGVMALPLAYGAVAVHRPWQEANGQRLYALVQALGESDAHTRPTFNAQVVDESGHVYLSLTGYRTIALEE